MAMKLLIPALAALLTAFPMSACQKSASTTADLAAVENQAPSARKISFVERLNPDVAFGEKVRSYLLEHPEVIEEAVERLQQSKDAAEAKAHDAEMIAARSAIPKLRQALERDPRDFVANPNGAITVVEFFDYNCGYCKLAAPEILRMIEQDPDIRFVFKEWPIFGEASDSAARISLTSAGKANGLKLYKAWMAEKPLNEAAIDRSLAAAGLNSEKLRADSQSPEITKQLADVRDLAIALKLRGTPAFIVGDQVVPGADMKSLAAAIATARRGDLKRPDGGIAKAG